MAGGTEFVFTLCGGAAWPLTARAQQAGRMQRIGVLMPFSPDDAESQTRMGAFLQTLALSGWTIGRNVRIDTRWGERDPERIHRHAVELVALAPDVIPTAIPTSPLMSAAFPRSIRSFACFSRAAKVFD